MNFNIYSAAQIKKWDEYTEKYTPIASIDLMQKAAQQCAKYIEDNFFLRDKIHIFCGNGNNGGDGIALARILTLKGYHTWVYPVAPDTTGSPDYRENLEKYRKEGACFFLDNDGKFPEIEDGVIVDAVFGTGLNKPVSGFYRDIIEFINTRKNVKVISIDIPSGMYADKCSLGNSVVKADITLTFQQKKLAFFMPENLANTGKIEVLDIGLLDDFTKEEKSVYQVANRQAVSALLKKRDAFSHKWNYGFACLIVGSYGMMGAAVLAANGCLRSGVGKLTCIVPEIGYDIMQISTPEAMCQVAGEKYISDLPVTDHFNVLGIGPGLGQYPGHLELLKKVFLLQKPLVIDADALNVISKNRDLLELMPEGTILSPHPREFQRLFGETKNDFDETELALEMARKYKVNIIVKGHFTLIATPDGAYFNETGNPGMATGGSGDVLTGILTGLLAQGYSPAQACLLGVYCHGLSGDIAAAKLSENSLIASDLYKNLGEAFLKLTKKEAVK